MTITVAPIAIIASLLLNSCAATKALRKEADLIPVLKIHELNSNPSKFHKQKVRLRGCLDFHGSHRYKLWNYDLTSIPFGSEGPQTTIFVEGKYIKSKYRKRDIDKETKIDETRSIFETVKDYKWLVEVYGTFLNKPHWLNTGGHIIFDDFFKYSLSEAIVVRELSEGCPEFLGPETSSNFTSTNVNLTLAPR